MTEVEKLKEIARTHCLDQETIDLINEKSYSDVSKAFEALDQDEKENDVIVQATILEALSPYREQLRASLFQFYALLYREFDEETRKGGKTKIVAKPKNKDELSNLIGEEVIVRNDTESFFAVYEGSIEGKHAFMIQDPESTPKILSYRTLEEHLRFEREIVLDNSKTELGVYEPGNPEYEDKKGLLEKNDLWTE
jgi:hypothetical protein